MSTQCEFLRILKMLIQVQAIRERNMKWQTEGERYALEEYGTSQLRALVNAAVEFCDNAESEQAQAVKEDVRTAMSKGEEKDRYIPICNSLNNAHDGTKSSQVGALKALDLSQTFLWTVNDTKPIGTREETPKGHYKGFRKPDLIAVDQKTGRQQLGLGREDVIPLSKVAMMRKESPQHLEWRDCLFALEIGAGKATCLSGTRLQELGQMFKTSRHPDYMKEIDRLQTSDQARLKERFKDGPTVANDPSTDSASAPAPANPNDSTIQHMNVPHTSQTGSLKRKSDSQGVSSDGQKRFRFDQVSEGPLRLSKMDKDVQSAYYGMDLLRSCPDRTHALVLVLTGSLFYIRWYDAQGLVGSDPIDIVKDLPLFVATTMLLQRFGTRMRGRAEFDLQVHLPGSQQKEPFAIPDCALGRYELRGRRPLTTVPVPAGFADVTDFPGSKPSPRLTAVILEEGKGGVAPPDLQQPDDAGSHGEQPDIDEERTLQARRKQNSSMSYRVDMQHSASSRGVSASASPLVAQAQSATSIERRKTRSQTKTLQVDQLPNNSSVLSPSSTSASPLPASRSYRDLPEDDKKKFEPFDNTWFKLSWRETNRDAEPKIIQTARERAREYLGERATDVTNHIPEVLGWGEEMMYSTGLVRELAGDSKGLAEIGRVPVWIIFAKLRPFDEVNFSDMPERMAEITRCHKLLWELGIAHGDVSFWNLMLTPDKSRAILIDYDLAAIMPVGAQSPAQRGFERTGTLPFMALELLDVGSNKPPPPRVYRHDLESILWCITWAISPQESWINCAVNDVLGNRGFFVNRLQQRFKDQAPQPGDEEAQALHRLLMLHRDVKSIFEFPPPNEDEGNRALLNAFQKFFKDTKAFSAWKWLAWKAGEPIKYYKRLPNGLLDSSPDS